MLVFLRNTRLDCDLLMKSQSWKGLEVSGWDQAVARCVDFWLSRTLEAAHPESGRVVRRKGTERR